MDNWIIGIGCILCGLAIVTIFVDKVKVKKERNRQLQAEEALLAGKKALQEEQIKAQKEREDLSNAQLMFRREQEAKADLSLKTEKEVAIDLYMKFMDMETFFDYMKNNLASIDAKLVGVKDYSVDLTRMERSVANSIESTRNETVGCIEKTKREMIDSIETINRDKGEQLQAVTQSVMEELRACKAEMIIAQKQYSEGLQLIYNELKNTLENVDQQIEETVSSITNTEMHRFSDTFRQKLDSLFIDVNQRMDVANGRITNRLENLAEEFGDRLEEHIPDTIDQADVENALSNVLSNYTISSLDSDDVEDAVNDAMNDYSVSSLDQDDVEEVVRRVVSENRSGMLDEESIKDAVENAMNGIFSSTSYSWDDNFQTGLQQVVEECVSSGISEVLSRLESLSDSIDELSRD